MAVRKGKLGTVYRLGTLEKRADMAEGGELSHEFAFSSEEKVQRWFGWEILSHEKNAIDMTRARRGLPLLLIHDRSQWPGSVNEFRVDPDKKCRGITSYTPDDLGQRTAQNVESGHWNRCSIGYRVLKAKRVEVDEAGMETWLVTRWMPVECSLEPLDADPVGSGLNRSADDDEDEFDMEVEEPSGEERTMDPKDVPGQGTPTPAAGAPPLSAGRSYTGTEAAEILGMAARNNLAERVPDWMARNLSPAEVALEIQRGLFKPAPGPQPSSEVLVVPRDLNRSRYRIQRAIAGQVAAREGKGRVDGREREVHEECLRKMPAGIQYDGGVLIPWRMRTEEELEMELDFIYRRTMGSTQPSGGATTVVPQIMDLLDILRPNSLVLSGGAEILPGLTAPVYWSRLTGDPYVYWMDENPPAGVPSTEAGYGYMALTPKPLMGKIPVPRMLLTISSIDMEAQLVRLLGIAHDLAIDRSSLHGTGTDKQPAGLYNMIGVQSHAVGGVPDRADIVTMEGLLGDKNAILTNISFAATPLLAAALKQVPMAANYPLFLWTGSIIEGTMEGYRARASSQVSKTLGAGANEHGLIIGNWGELVVGLFGNALEIDVDRFSDGDKGNVIIRSYSMADIGAKHPEAFVVGTGATTS